jgi:sugar phosphate isomerase/epimerase
MQSLQWNRRRWLAASSAAVSTAFFSDLSLCAAAKGDDPFQGWRIGAQSYSLRNFDFAQAVRHLQGLGLHYVELYSKHLAVDATTTEIAATRATLKQAGIRMNAHGVNGFTKNHDANRKIFAFANRAGLKNITANPQLDSFDSLDKLVAEYNIRICIHNHGPGALYDSIQSVVDAVKDHHPLIGACVDTGHFIRSKQDPVQAVYDLGKRVFALHIKDEAKQEKRSHNVVIGKGHLDVVGLFKSLKKIDFPADGAISLEYEANPENPIDDMRQCLSVATEAIGKVGPFHG